MVHLYHGYVTNNQRVDIDLGIDIVVDVDGDIDLDIDDGYRYVHIVYLI